MVFGVFGVSRASMYYRGATRRSYSTWSPSQSSALVPENHARRKAVRPPPNDCRIAFEPFRRA